MVAYHAILCIFCLPKKSGKINSCYTGNSENMVQYNLFWTKFYNLYKRACSYFSMAVPVCPLIFFWNCWAGEKTQCWHAANSVYGRSLEFSHFKSAGIFQAVINVFVISSSYLTVLMCFTVHIFFPAFAHAGGRVGFLQTCCLLSQWIGVISKQGSGRKCGTRSESLWAPHLSAGNH